MAENKGKDIKEENSQTAPEDDNPTLTPLKIWKFYQQNLRIAEQSQADILLGLKAGTDTETLLIKAAETIGALVNDPNYPQMVRMELDKRHGTYEEKV